MDYEFKKLSDVNIAESIGNAAHVLIEDGGEIKRVAKDKVGGITEEWTFTLEDGLTVTKKVVISE